MKEFLDSDDFMNILTKIAIDMDTKRDLLCQLDGAVGDGDLGVTVSVGFDAVKAGLKDLEGAAIGTILAKSGENFNNAAGSTFGILLALAMIEAGKEAKDKKSMDLGGLVKMAESAERVIRERGKANIGDKTMLDAIAPAVEALRRSYEEGKSIAQALDSASNAARKGVEATIPMRAKAGRSRWLGDKTVGVQDPGATAFYLLVEICREYVSARNR